MDSQYDQCDTADWLRGHQDKSRRRLTPQKIHEKLEKLHLVDNQVEEHDATRSSATRSVENTIAWLKQHKEQKAKSSGFIESLLHWFKDEPEDQGPQLPLDWAQEKLKVSWTERSYAILNAPFYVDMMHARRIILSGALLDVIPEIGADFKIWIDEFFEQLCLAHVVKDNLLQEKARVANKAIRVVTQYDTLQTLYENSLLLDVKTVEYGEKLLECFNEVEATLRDESAAVSEANPLVMSALLENEAFSALFSTMETNEPTGPYVAKLVAWMKNALPREDFDAFMALFPPKPNSDLLANGCKRTPSTCTVLSHFRSNIIAQLCTRDRAPKFWRQSRIQANLDCIFTSDIACIVHVNANV
ncbi:hypothetical protein Ae201684P_005615 [Aphanomyces euteiches]|nr:hypothetical protein Ae201684P_005615 [Aphanomyces euteiches]